MTRPDLFGLSEKELMSLLKEEQKKTKELAAKATLEIHQWSTKFGTLSIKPNITKLDKEGFDLRAKLMAAITEEYRKQEQINITLGKIKSGNFGYNDVLGFDYVKDTSNIGEKKGDGAHDKYARVMENLTYSADVRDTWDSYDVLKIDDVAIERGVSYDKAKEIVEQQISEGQELPEGV